MKSGLKSSHFGTVFSFFFLSKLLTTVKPHSTKYKHGNGIWSSLAKQIEIIKQYIDSFYFKYNFVIYSVFQQVFLETMPFDSAICNWNNSVTNVWLENGKKNSF